MKKFDQKASQKLVSFVFIALMLCSIFAGAVSAENVSEDIDDTILNETGDFDTPNSSDNHSLSSEIDTNATLDSNKSLLPASASTSNNMVINEIMFNPVVEDAGDEWIEIYNPSNETKNINGWIISNRTGAAIATLPDWDFPNGTYLVVHFGNGTNDNNFTNGTGHYYTNNSIEVFNNTEDECALYNGTPSASSIIDFVSWCSDGLYSGGVAHDYAVSAGIWDSGNYFDITWNINGVLNGESIGRDKYLTDTNKPSDWDNHGGAVAYFPTPGASNTGPLYSIDAGIKITQTKVNHLLVLYGFNIINASHTNIQESEAENDTFVNASHYFVTEYDNTTVMFNGTGVFHWFRINSTSWKTEMSFKLYSDYGETVTFNYSKEEYDLFSLTYHFHEMVSAIYSTENANNSTYQEDAYTTITQTDVNTFHTNITQQIIDDGIIKNIQFTKKDVIHSDTHIEVWKDLSTTHNIGDDTSLSTHYNTYINPNDVNEYESIFDKYTITKGSDMNYTLDSQGYYKTEKVSNNHYNLFWNYRVGNAEEGYSNLTGHGYWEIISVNGEQVVRGNVASVINGTQKTVQFYIDGGGGDVLAGAACALGGVTVAYYTGGGAVVGGPAGGLAGALLGASIVFYTCYLISEGTKKVLKEDTTPPMFAFKVIKYHEGFTEFELKAFDDSDFRPCRDPSGTYVITNEKCIEVIKERTFRAADCAEEGYNWARETFKIRVRGKPCPDEWSYEGDVCTGYILCHTMCHPKTGTCGKACSSSPGLGCVHPDDSYDVSTISINFNKSNTISSSEIGVLLNGMAPFCMESLDSLGERCAFIDLDASIEELRYYPILVIPSGGLYGLDNSPGFKSKLEEYVNNGGTLIVFSQPHGYEYNALPGGEVSGYGWFEDQNCHYHSVDISTYHPILSGQDSVTSDVNVDGYFTKYPENATILLSRTKNGQPALIVYEYGNGTVIVTAAYTDWAYSHHQATEDGKNLIRDMITWAKDPKDIPDYASGDAIDIPVEVTNNANETADKVVFNVVDPDKNVSDYVNVSSTILPGERKTINFTYTAPSKLGIWWIDYSLYNNSNVTQTVYEVQRFAVSKYAENPEGWTYHGANISFSITTPDDCPCYGEDVPFTVHVLNREDRDRNITVVYWDDNLGGYQSWASWERCKNCIEGGFCKFGCVNKTLRVPAQDKDSFTFVHYNVYSLTGSAFDAYFYDEYGNLLGWAIIGIRPIRPSINVQVKTDKKEYAKGEDVSILLNLTNLQEVSHNTTVTVRTLDPAYKKIYEHSFNINLGALASETKTLDFSLPIDSERGVYIVTAEAYEKEKKIGSNSTYFKICKDYFVDIEFDKLDEVYRARQNMTVYINATNVGASLWNSVLDISIPSLDFNDTRSVTVNPNETESFSYRFRIPENISAGKHDVIVTISYDNSTTQDCFFIPGSKLLHSLEKTDYSAGENVSIKFENTGGVDTTYTFSAILRDPYLSTIFEDSKSGIIEAGEVIIFNSTIPIGAINGTYYLKLEYEDLGTNKASSSINLLSVSGLKALLTSKTDKKVYSAGEDITVLTNITNLNGEITGATLNLKVLSSKPISKKPCVVPTDDLYINSDTILCPGIYNINDSGSKGVMIINASGVVVEGNDTVLVGTGSGYGIYNSNFDDVAIRNIEVKNYYHGICLMNSNKNTLTNNKVSNNDYGICLMHSNKNTLTNNKVSNNTYGIYVYISSNNTITNNEIDIESGTTGFFIKSSDKNTLANNTASNSNSYGYGIQLIGSRSNTLTNNTASNNFCGIYLDDYSNYNTITNNTASNNSWDGICLYRSGSNTITNNTVSNNDDGIFLTKFSKNNTIKNNTASNNNNGIYILFSSNNNTITNNEIDESSESGFLIGEDSFYNSIVDNKVNGDYYYHYVNASDLVIEDLVLDAPDVSNLGKISLINCTNVTLRNLTIANNYEYGVYVYESKDITIENNNVSSNGHGIYLGSNAYQNTIANNTVNSNNYYGIYLYGSSNNTITNNTANSNNYDGIYLGSSSNNVLSENIFCSNWNDIHTSYCYSKNSGTNNTCNNTLNWNDEGTTGCTYLCTGVSTFSTTSFVSTEYIFSNRAPVLDFILNVTVNETDLVVISPTATDPDNDTLVFTFTPPLNSSGMWQTTYGDAGIYTTTVTVYDGELTDSQNVTIAVLNASIDQDNTAEYTPTPAITGNNASNILKIESMATFGIKERIPIGVSQIFSPVRAAEGDDSPITFTSSNSTSNNESNILWEQNLSINVTDFANISTSVGELNATGKLYLYATLYSRTGQIIAYNISTFYITDKDLSLTMETAKRVYKSNETINIYGEVKNHGSNAESCNLSIKKDGIEIFADTFALNPDETYDFATNTSSNTSFTLEGTVNGVNVTDFVSVEQPNINVSVIAPEVVGVSPFNVAVLIENTGNISADLNVKINSTWNLTIPEGELRLLETTMSIKKNTTLNVTISGDVNRTIQKEIICGENARINITPQPTYLKGTVEIPYVIENTGLLDSEFNATFAIDAQTVTESFFVPKDENITGSAVFNLTLGAHLLRYVSPFEAVNVTINVLSPPEFVVTSIYPEDMNFTLGQNVILMFDVENTGGTEGEATLRLEMPDFEDTNRTWVRPGAEENISFNLSIPDDLEEKNYKGIYELEGKREEFRFFVQGAKISVDASLDKNLYDESETAILTLNVDNERNIDLSLYSRVKFNEYDSVQNFTLPGLGSKTLTFNVPVNFTGDNKMLYTVYMDTGRSLYINSMYVYEKKPDVPIRLYTDKDVYNMGESVTIHIIDVTKTDVLNLTAPGYTYNNTISGPAMLEFTLPELRSGTYYIEYSFGNFSAEYPFDVIGYSARIIESHLDKEVYNQSDIVKVRMNVEVNQNISGVLKLWIYDPENELIEELEMDKDFVKGENKIELSRVFSTNLSGIHVLVYGIYAHSDLIFLASGAEYFDVEIEVEDTTPPLVTNPTATPPSIVADGIQESQLNVTVTDESEIASVTVSLSSIGGSPTQEMNNIPGTDVYTVNATASVGTEPDIYELQVTATDIYGNSNTSVGIALTVTEAVDTIPPTIESVTLDAYTTIPDATIHLIVNATDNVGVDSVTADDVNLVETGSTWEGDIVAPSTIGDYTLTIRAEDAAGNFAETTVDYSVVTPQGGMGVAVLPRLSPVTAGSTVDLNVKIVSNENFDDVFHVYLTTDGLPPIYQADLSWFNWTDATVAIPAGGEAVIPLRADIPGGASGIKAFRAKVESTKWTPKAMDTGIFSIS